MGEGSWWTIPVPSLVILVPSVCVLSCGQTHTHTHTHIHAQSHIYTDSAKRFTPATVVGVSKCSAEFKRQNFDPISPPIQLLSSIVYWSSADLRILVDLSPSMMMSTFHITAQPLRQRVISFSRTSSVHGNVSSGWSGQIKQESQGSRGVGNLAHFEHKRTLYNMDNTIFSLTSGAHATAGGGGSNSK